MRHGKRSASPAVFDAVAEDLDEKLLWKAASERDNAPGSFNHRSMLDLFMTQLCNMAQQTLYSSFDLPNAGLVGPNGLVRSVDDLRGGF